MTALPAAIPATAPQPNAFRTATLAARVIGVFTLGWVYLAYTDLRWLLHLHRLHFMVTRAPLQFSYPPYLACTVLNLAVAIIAAGTLLLFPVALLRTLTPKSLTARPARPGWFTTGLAVGLVVVLLCMYEIMATVLWTIYQRGNDAGWQTDLAAYALIAAGGFYLCRRTLAGPAHA
jgi:hypothetical protein